MSYWGYFRILRPVNSIVAGLAAALAYLVATGTLVPSVLLLIVIVFLVTGAGNVINDFFDASIDRVNRPERPIPSGAVPEERALRYAAVLFLAGIGISAFTNTFCFALALFNSLLLVWYSKTLKRTMILGNLAVAYLAGSIFLFGGGYAGYQGFINNLPIFLITVLAMMARELLKAAEDIPGDRESGARTFPIVHGIRPTLLISVIFTVCAIMASLVPYLRWGTGFLAGIIPVDIIILYAVIRPLPCRTPECIRNSRSTDFLKYGMFLSLVVFTVSAVLFS